jgi:uncharacterized protein (DUF1697 family)
MTDRFGFDVPVVVRTAAELAAAIRDNPFPDACAEPKCLHVGFLADRPDQKRVAALDPKRSPPDAFAVRGREVYMHCPNGVARTKLTTPWFDSGLDTCVTFRNWNTVLKLLELARS